MYAIVQQGGHQYRVSPGDRLVVDRLEAEVGSVIALEPVLLVQAESGDATLGAPTVDGARVAAVIVAHTKGRKLRVFKYKPKKRYRRTQGHRSLLTELRIEALLAAGEPLPKAKAEKEKAEKPQAAEAKAEKPRAQKAKATAVEEAPEQEAATAEAEAPVAAAEEAPKPRARRSRAKTTPAEAEDDAAVEKEEE